MFYTILNFKFLFLFSKMNLQDLQTQQNFVSREMEKLRQSALIVRKQRKKACKHATSHARRKTGVHHRPSTLRNAKRKDRKCRRLKSTSNTIFSSFLSLIDENNYLETMIKFWETQASSEFIHALKKYEKLQCQKRLDKLQMTCFHTDFFADTLHKMSKENPKAFEEAFQVLELVSTLNSLMLQLISKDFSAHKKFDETIHKLLMWSDNFPCGVFTPFIFMQIKIMLEQMMSCVPSYKIMDAMTRHCSDEHGKSSIVSIDSGHGFLELLLSRNGFDVKAIEPGSYKHRAYCTHDIPGHVFDFSTQPENSVLFFGFPGMSEHTGVMDGSICNYTKTFLNAIASGKVSRVIVICCDYVKDFLSNPSENSCLPFVCGTPDLWSFLSHLKRKKPFHVSSFLNNKFMIVFDVSHYKSLELLERGQKQGYKVDPQNLVHVASNTITKFQEEILELKQSQQNHIADNVKDHKSIEWIIDRIETRKNRWTTHHEEDMQNPDCVSIQDRIVKDHNERMSEFDEQICTYRVKMTDLQQNCDQSVQELEKKINRFQKTILAIRGKYNL